MNERQEKWLQALESGAYPQTQKTLRDWDGFCCLGVLCDVYREITGKGEWRETAGGYDFYPDPENAPCDYGSSYPPVAVREYFGLDDESGSYRDYDSSLDCLTNRNDSGSDFKEIAQIIRDHADDIFAAGTEPVA